MVGLAVASALSAAPPPRVLRVCAAPDSLPFSNLRGEGFENRLAELVARELKATLEYVWCPPQGAAPHELVENGLADVVMGVPAGWRRLRTTRPYYSSSYMFVYRRGAFPVSSFDDPALRIMRIGVQMAGGNFDASLPAHALVVRGHLENIRGYAFFHERPQVTPASEMLGAVARGEIDVAVAWGPVAAYFCSRQQVPLEIAPVLPQQDGPNLTFVFPIAIGVRSDDRALQVELDAVIVRRRDEIIQMLDASGVPRVPLKEPAAAHCPPPV